MSRRRKSITREINPDPVYQSIVVTKFINCLMNKGKKSISENIFYSALKASQTKISKEEPINIFYTALNNVKPHLEVRSRRVGGSTYQIPVDVREERKNALAIRWIISFSRKRSGNSMIEKLANELCDAYNNKGNAVKKKEDTHKMAESNRAFAHYIW